MKAKNRYVAFERYKLGKSSLPRDVESFEELQQRLLEELKKKKTTRRKLEKFRKAIKESPVEVPLTTRSGSLRYLARKFSVRNGDLLAFLRAHAFKHVPATKRYIRAKRYESPLATRLYVNGMRKKRKTLKKRFSEADVAAGILAGELAIYSGDAHKTITALKIASLGLEHEGAYAITEPPEDVKAYFTQDTRRVEGKTYRALSVPLKDSDVIVLLK